MATNVNIPIPQNPIGENYPWRDWFQKLSNKVYGSLASQNSNGVTITGGTIDNTAIGSTTPSTGSFTSLKLGSPLKIAYGGTNGFAVPTAGAVAYGNGGAYSFTAVGTTGQVLTSNAGSTPTWTTVVNKIVAGTNITISPTGGTGTVTINASTGTTGTVTSVGLALPSSVFNVTNSPVTTTGTLTGTLTTQAVNSIFAGPSSGVGSFPTFRALVTADIPALPYATYPGSGIPNSTGTAWGTSYSTTGSNKVVLSTAPTFDTTTSYTSIAQPSYSEGMLWYDSTQKALSYFNDVSGNVITIGQETQVKVKNGTGSSIAAGIAVYVTSTSSSAIYPLVAPAQANSIATSAVIGLATQSIASGAVGYVTTAGLLTPVNTGTFTVGDVLYLSPYSAGQIQNTVPPTGYPIQIGVVAYSNTPNGSIYVKQTTPLAVSAATLTGQVAIANGGTNGTATPTSGAISYGTGTAYGFTSVGTTGQVLTSAGSGTPTWQTPTTGTVTSVGMSVPSILSVTPSTITTSGSFALSLTTESANQIFAGPSSGAAATPTFRSLTSADIPALPYGTGTVTSVALALPSIMSVSGSPVTTTGTLTGTLTTQAANNLFAGPASGSATTPTFRALVSTDIPTLSQYQATLVSGTNIKTVTGNTLLGSGDVGTIGIAYGGTGSTTASGALTSLGASPLSGSSSLITLGTVTTGTWNAGTIPIAYGGTASTTASGALTSLGAQAIAAPTTVTTSTYSLSTTDLWVINNYAGTCTLTLPTASSYSGRVLNIQNYQAFTVVSASSNVIPIAGGSASTAILNAIAGDRCTLVSNGTNWVMTQYTPNNILLQG